MYRLSGRPLKVVLETGNCECVFHDPERMALNRSSALKALLSHSGSPTAVRSDFLPEAN
jgi:hypothetical protein